MSNLRLKSLGQGLDRMNLLELVQARGLTPKKVSSTNGGEYHSPCPECGGTDRFSIQLGKNRYFCRQCRKTGDAIKFLREFEGRSFKDAATCVGRSLGLPAPSIPLSACDRLLWKEKATKFVHDSHLALLKSREALESVYQRGINLHTIEQYKLGWNQRDQWQDSDQWGFLKEKRIYLPAGIVIPALENGEVFKLKIRRSAWHPGNHLPKYLEVRGSDSKLHLLSRNRSRPTMIMESELDALLMAQEAEEICNFAALGGATKRPDPETKAFLSRCPWIFYSLDNDEAGISALRWWEHSFPRVKLWMPPSGKSPGDAQHAKVDLNAWVNAGIASARSQDW